MHDLITGGTGFIGTALCRSLTGAGHRVTVLTRSTDTATERLPDDVNAVETLADLHEVDTVYNLAGEALASERWTPSRKRLLRDSRIDVTRNLVAWMSNLEKRPSVLISASAIGYYGPHGDELVTETTPSGHDFASNLCQAWETEARRAEALNVRVCIPRIGIVLGPDGGILTTVMPGLRLGFGGAIGSGRQWVSWIHRSDLIRLLTWLATTPTTHGVYNATAPHPIKNAEFARALARVLHRPAPLPVPAALLKLMLGEMASVLITGQRVVPERTENEGFHFDYETIEKALETLEPALRSLLDQRLSTEPDSHHSNWN